MLGAESPASVETLMRHVILDPSEDPVPVGAVPEDPPARPAREELVVSVEDVGRNALPCSISRNA